MAIPYNSTAYDTHKCTGADTRYPFANYGDSATKVYVHAMRGNRSTYAPLAFNDEMTTADEKPNGSPFSDDSAAFWVGDSIPQDQKDGTVKYERTFANIPATRIEGNGIYAFTYPGVSSTTTSTIATSTGNESVSFDSGTGEGVMVFDVAPGDTSKFTVGQKLHVNNNNQTYGAFQGKRTGGLSTWYNYYINNGFVTDITSNTITIKEVLSPTSWEWTDFRSEVAITTFAAQSILKARDPFTNNATSIRNYNYLKSDDLIGIPISAKFNLVNSSGAPTNELTNTTNPTKVEYLNLIEDSEYIAAESTQITRWMGNIWQKQQILVQVL